jgi:hypothetical protein
VLQHVKSAFDVRTGVVGQMKLFTFAYRITLNYMQKLISIFLFIVAITITSVVFAQPGPPSGPPCGGPFGPACPIDGGVSILIAAGLAYGGKKSYDMARRKQ